jgi:uncharacterized membrane protein
MDQLFVLTFDTEESATQALHALRGLEGADKIHFEDTAVVTRDADGTAHVKNEASAAAEVGAGVGGMVGLMVAGVLFPVVGLAVGAAIGAGIGALAHKGVDGKFVDEVKADLEPGKSALFMVTQQANAGLLVAALRPYSGKVIQTSVDEEFEASLNAALKD